MNYDVVIAPRALSDAEEIYRWIPTVQMAPTNVARWFDGVFEAIGTLAELPHRFAPAPESVFLEREIRQLIYHNHRVLFAIEGDIVEVFHIRHGAMTTATRTRSKPMHRSASIRMPPTRQPWGCSGPGRG